MDINWDTFYTAYQAATPEVKVVIDSSQIPTCVKNLVETEKLDAHHYQDIVKLYSLYILGAITESVFIEKMKHAGMPNSQTLFQALQECRSKTPVIPYTHEDEEGGMDSEIAETEAALQAATLSHHELAKDLAAAEAVLDSEDTAPIPPPPPAAPIPQVPTEKDPETVYSSTQSAILNDRSKPTMPIPRWDSEK